MSAPLEAPTSAATARHLGVRLAGRSIVRDVTLDMPQGAWVCIVGPNGAGKTTLLHAIAGLIPFEGEVELRGRPLRSYGRRERARNVALVPQQPVMPDGITVGEYVRLGRTPHLGVLGAELREDVLAVEAEIGRMDLRSAVDRRLDSLSGGEFQRVVIARALVQEAPLLLLDEPTTGLDLGHQVGMLELVEELRRTKGITVLSTMHDLTLAGRFADRFVLLSQGRVVSAGPRSDVLDAAVIAEHFGASVRVLGDGEVGWAVVPVSGGEA
ncbi:MAG TPA: ABC transporter ATP-binding protein [Actinomycetota bacterium]|nr:ABC transporter ATP-binding protein [Actinomycetota bacterium]